MRSRPEATFPELLDRIGLCCEPRAPRAQRGAGRIPGSPPAASCPPAPPGSPRPAPSQVSSERLRGPRPPPPGGHLPLDRTPCSGARPELSCPSGCPAQEPEDTPRGPTAHRTARLPAQAAAPARHKASILLRPGAGVGKYFPKVSFPIILKI